MERDPWIELAEAARLARDAAYAPYSGFHVGAALETEDGTVFRGANVENRVFGLCLCAERGAVAAAVTAGHRAFRRLAVVTAASPPAAPCGQCLDTLAELADDLPILLANPDGERRETTLRELHPSPFVLPSG